MTEKERSTPPGPPTSNDNVIDITGASASTNTDGV